MSTNALPLPAPPPGYSPVQQQAGTPPPPAGYFPLSLDASQPAPSKPDDTSTIGGMLQSYWHQVNPVARIEAMAHPILHPVDTAETVASNTFNSFKAARDAFEKGDYVAGVKNAFSYLTGGIPTMEPVAFAGAVQKAGKGDINGALTDASAEATNALANVAASKIPAPKVPARAAAVAKAAASAAADALPDAAAGAVIGGVIKGVPGAIGGAAIPVIRAAAKAGARTFREFGAEPAPSALDTAAEYYRNQNIPGAAPAPAPGEPPITVEPANAPPASGVNVPLRPPFGPRPTAENPTPAAAPPPAVQPSPATPALASAPAASQAPASPTPEEMAAAFNPDKAAFEKAQAARQAAADAKHIGARNAWSTEMADRLFGNGKGITPQDAQLLSPLNPDGTYTVSPELDQLARAKNGSGKGPLPPASKMRPDTILRMHMKLWDLWNDSLPPSAPPVGHSAFHPNALP